MADKGINGNLSPDIVLTSSVVENQNDNFNLDQDSRLKRNLARIFLIGALSVGGAVAGLITATQRPSEAEFLPGIKADISITHSSVSELSLLKPKSYSVIDNLPSAILTAWLPNKAVNHRLGDVFFPNMHQSIPLVGKVALDAKLQSVNASNIKTTALAGAITHPKRLIEQPILNVIKEHVIDDTTQGAELGSGVFFLTESLLLYYQKKKRLDDQKNNLRISHLAMVGLGLSSVVVSGGIFISSHNNKIPKNTMPINNNLTAGINVLYNVRVSGSLTYYDEQLNQALALKASVDKSYQRVLSNLQVAFQNWFTDLQNQSYMNNPNYERVVIDANTHCSYPYSTKILPLITNRMKANLIYNTGDYEVSSGMLPFENSWCIGLLKNGIKAAVAATRKPVYEVLIQGDDDYKAKNPTVSVILPDGKKYQAIKTLNNINNYTTTVNGFTQIGGPDPRRHQTGLPMMSAAGKSINHQAQVKLETNAGIPIAKAACLKFGVKTIISHTIEQAMPALNENCGVNTAIISEDNSKRGFVKIITAPNGLQQTIFFQGTSSGINPNHFTFYEKIVTDAPTYVLFFNKKSGLPVGYVSINILPDSQVSIDNVISINNINYLGTSFQ